MDVCLTHCAPEADAWIVPFEDGELRCEIYRVADPYADTTVNIPGGAQTYTVSSDNLGGMIVAASF